MGKDENVDVSTATEGTNHVGTGEVSSTPNQIPSDQVQQEAIEKAKQEAAHQAELQQQLQEQELKKQQEFQAQQQALQQQMQVQQEQKEAALKQEIAEANADVAGGPSGFKRVLCFILLAFFIVMVIFLPQITEFINAKINERNTQEITTGHLICTLSKTTSNLDVGIEADFNFVNNEVIKLTYTTTYTGDATTDKEELQKYNEDCIILKNIAVQYEGISTTCSLNNGISIEKQVFDYEKLDAKKANAAYAEAGGIYPDYKKGDKISDVESKMTSSGYSCNKVG